MHLKRWITSIVALPVLVYIVHTGGIAFSALIAAACLLALWEYFGIVFNTYQANSPAVMGLGFVTALLLTVAAHYFGAEMLFVVLAANVVLSAIIFLSLFKTRPQIIELLRIQAQGILYIPLSLSLLVLIRNMADGSLWIFFLLAIIFAGDVSAYYFGSYLGKHKLSPSISPGKTMEGAAGGIMANVIVGTVFKFILFPGLDWGICIMFFIVIGAAGQVGDLFESGLKRMSGVKDSGFLLPGHGGIIDRIDALLFATPVMYFFILFANGGF